MATNNEKRRSIKIKESTYQAIKKQGIMGETFDNVLQRILEMHKLKDRKPSKKSKEIANKLR